MCFLDNLPLRAYYTPADDLFIVEFLNPAIFFPLSENKGRWRWSMFTHGVCSDVRDGNFWFNGIAITGRHLFSDTPDAKNLGERLDRAAHRLANRSANKPPGAPASIHDQRSAKAARLLLLYREQIIADLLA